MTVLNISGIPNEVKQMASLRIYLRKAGIEKFWIVKVCDTRDTEMKEAVIEITSDEDVVRLEKFLKKVPYKRAGIPYFLRAERERSRVSKRSYQTDHGDGYAEEHSRNQGSQSTYDDVYTIDMEMEILKKKKQLIEEERRLIAESKKLQRMTESSASVSKQNGKYQGPATRKTRPKKDDKSNVPWVPPKRHDGIPLFTFPIKTLFKKIKPIIRKKTDVPQERSIVEQLIRAQLRRVLALALSDHQERVSSNDIVALYRQQHPESGDAKLVMQALDEVRSSFWPMTKRPIKKKPIPQQKKNNTAPSTSAVAKIKKETTTIKNESFVPMKKEVDAGARAEEKKSSDVKSQSAQNTDKAKSDVVEPAVASNVSNNASVADQDKNTDASQATAPEIVGQGETTIKTREPAGEVAADQTTNTKVDEKAEPNVDRAPSEVVDPVETTDDATNETTKVVKHTESNIDQTVKVVNQVKTPDITSKVITDAITNQATNTKVGEQTESNVDQVTNVENDNPAGIDQPEYNPQVVPDNDDWVTNGIDWNDYDDDDEHKNEE